MPLPNASSGPHVCECVCVLINEQGVHAVSLVNVSD